MSRTTELAQIHIAKKQLGMDDDTYRAMLQNITGKDSSKDMDITDRYRVLAHLKKVGFKPKRGKASINDQRTKIHALWSAMAKSGLIKDGSTTALNHWVKRMTEKFNQGKGIESVTWLTNTRTAQRVLESLKQWQKRLEQARVQEQK